MMRLVAGLLFALVALCARADFTMTMDSMNSPPSSSISLTVTVVLLSGSQSSPAPISGTQFVPFKLNPGASPITLNFLGISSPYTAIGIRATITPTGMTASVTQQPIVIDTFFAPQAVPANRMFTIVYTAPLLTSGTMTGTLGPDTTPPTAPGLLSVSVDSASPTTNLDLAWSAATDNTGVSAYLVERCQDIGCSTFSQIASVIANPTAFADGGLTPGTSYSYRVRATDAAGNMGPYSNTASAVTASTTPPPPPPSGTPSKVGSSVCVGTAAHSIPCTSPALSQLVAQDGAVWTITGLGTSSSPTKVFRNGVDTKNIYPDANVLYVFQNSPSSPIEISVFSNAHGHVCWNGSWGGC